MFTNGLFRSGRRQKSNVYIRRHQGASYTTLNGKNVNVMLESRILSKEESRVDVKALFQLRSILKGKICS